MLHLGCQEDRGEMGRKFACCLQIPFYLSRKFASRVCTQMSFSMLVGSLLNVSTLHTQLDTFEMHPRKKINLPQFYKFINLNFEFDLVQIPSDLIVHVYAPFVKVLLLVCICFKGLNR